MWFICYLAQGTGEPTYRKREFVCFMKKIFDVAVRNLEGDPYERKRITSWKRRTQTLSSGGKGSI